MYLRFGTPIDTSTPLGIDTAEWVEEVKRRTQTALEQILDDLLSLRETDPLPGAQSAGLVASRASLTRPATLRR